MFVFEHAAHPLRAIRDGVVQDLGVVLGLAVTLT